LVQPLPWEKARAGVELLTLVPLVSLNKSPVVGAWALVLVDLLVVVINNHNHKIHNNRRESLGLLRKITSQARVVEQEEAQEEVLVLVVAAVKTAGDVMLEPDRSVPTMPLVDIRNNVT
jgi:hypothetical protein